MKKELDENDMSMDLTQLQPIVDDFVKRLKQLKNEQELLRSDEKNLYEEFEKKLDVKIVKQVLRVLAIKEKVENKDTFELVEKVILNAQ